MQRTTGLNQLGPPPRVARHGKPGYALINKLRTRDHIANAAKRGRLRAHLFGTAGRRKVPAITLPTINLPA